MNDPTNAQVETAQPVVCAPLSVAQLLEDLERAGWHPRLCEDPGHGHVDTYAVFSPRGHDREVHLPPDGQAELVEARAYLAALGFEEDLAAAREQPRSVQELLELVAWAGWQAEGREEWVWTLCSPRGTHHQVQLPPDTSDDDLAETRAGLGRVGLDDDLRERRQRVARQQAALAGCGRVPDVAEILLLLGQAGWTVWARGDDLYTARRPGRDTLYALDLRQSVNLLTVRTDLAALGLDDDLEEVRAARLGPAEVSAARFNLWWRSLPAEDSALAESLACQLVFNPAPGSDAMSLGQLRARVIEAHAAARTTMNLT